MLEKEIHIEYESEIRTALRGKRVLITGAGGSIGSELVAQLLHFEPEALILFDHSEYNLFRLMRKLEDSPSITHTKPILGSITDELRLLRVFSRTPATGDISCGCLQTCSSYGGKCL